MSNDIDIHQLDPERQVLFLLNESGNSLSVQEIESKLLEYGVSPDAKGMKSLLSSSLRDTRRKFIKDGLVHKNNNTYKIMQKGKEYLKSTIVIIDSSRESHTHETVSKLLSGLSGDIKLCDPYFDGTAFNLLKNHLSYEKVKSIKVIHGTNRIDSKKNYGIGKHSVKLKKKKDIHDRFVIDDNHLYFFGASLNSIGNKLSFIFDLTVYKNKFNEVFQNYWNS